MTKFVIMGNAKEYCEVMCGDILGRKEIVFINKHIHFKSVFSKSLDRKLKRNFRETVRPEVQDLSFIFFDSHNRAKEEKCLKYLSIFNAPEKIDLSFIKSGVKPDYHYQGQYSANNFKAC